MEGKALAKDLRKDFDPDVRVAFSKKKSEKNNNGSGSESVKALQQKLKSLGMSTGNNIHSIKTCNINKL